MTFSLASLSSTSSAAKTFLPSRFEITFTKELQSILKKKKESKGKMIYQYPNKIRIEQDRPFKTMYISNGQKAWLYSAPLDPRKEKGEVTILNPREIPITKIFTWLRKGPESNKIYKVSKKANVLTLTFHQKSRKRYQIEFVKVEMNHSKTDDFNQIKSLIIKTENSTERYKITAINPSPKIPSGYFDFKITEKMNVSENF
ncbi:MAG: outer-membrane lipoprotein carrier protein LolA [Bacteriovoracales bacterium]|nr:outer-membrane lipoprotein carrier protein LolA [Bacteriovoracales bacterium]